MKSLILTSLYLFKDTLYRWKERPSSALARLLVVFFLSLCSLSFLATYVFSTKMVENELKKNGGDCISVYNAPNNSNPGTNNMVAETAKSVCDAEILELKEIRGASANIGDKSLPIAEYGDLHTEGFEGIPLDKKPYLVLLPSNSTLPDTPSTFEVDDFSYTMPTFRLPEDHILNRTIWYREGLVLVPEGASGVKQSMVSERILIGVKEMTYENIARIHEILENISRFDRSRLFISSFKDSLARLQVILSNQTECRAGFSIGIAVIVGILLTAIASMEFRQNEYVYTLMKSFGVHPALLIFTFIGENILLVGVAFISAVFFFMETQKIVLGELFKLKNAFLNFSDIQNDIYLLAGSLLVCVFISAIPIAISAYREIGRVLK